MVTYGEIENFNHFHKFVTHCNVGNRHGSRSVTQQYRGGERSLLYIAGRDNEFTLLR